MTRTSASPACRDGLGGPAADDGLLERLLQAIHAVTLAADAATTAAPLAALVIEQACAVTGSPAGRLVVRAPEGAWCPGDWHGPDPAAVVGVQVAGPAAIGPSQLLDVPVLVQREAVATLQLARRPDAAELPPVVSDALLSLAGQLGRVVERERAAAAVQAGRGKTQAVIAQAYDAYVEIDSRGIVTAWSAKAEAMFGWSAGEALGQQLEGLVVPPSLRESYRASVLEAAAGRTAESAQQRRTVRHRDGHEFAVELALSARCEEGSWRLSAFVRDIGTLVAAESEAARQRLYLDAALQSVADGVAVCDAEGKLVTLNESMRRRLGLGGRSDLPLLWLEDLVVRSEDGAPLPVEELPLYRALLGETLGPQTLLLSRPGGPTYRMVVHARPLDDIDGTRLGAVAMFDETSAQVPAAGAETDRRRRDGLTGLGNERALRECLARAQAHGQSSQLLLIRVSDVRSVLAGSGTDAAEALVQDVARRLRSTVREDDVLARTDVDEFAVLSQSGRNEDVAPLAQRVRAALELSTDGAGVGRLGVSIGAATSHSGTVDLLHDAAVALNAAASVGAGRIEVFHDVMREQLQERLELRADLQRALLAGEFELRYQPQVDLTTGTVVAAEALVRWQHPTRGLVRPDEFIPLAEETGLIVPLGRWVLQAAVAQLAAWRRAGHTELGLGVNVSAVQLDQQLVQDVRDALARHGVDARWLDLELTETAAVQQGSASLSVLTELAEVGVSLSIDDFGTGYSMLGQLRALPFRRLKIDKSFVGECDQGAGAPLVVAMIAMARGLDLDVVAEGVETEAQLAFLRAEGCQTAQGYLFARPMSADELEALLTSAHPLTRLPAPAAPVPAPADPEAFGLLVRPLLEQLERVTGLESTYLTRVRGGQQEIVTARNSGDLAIPEGMRLPWPDSLCSRALVDGPAALTDVPEQFPDCDAVTELGIRSYLGVPILDTDGSLVGTLCGASAGAVPIDRDTLDTVAFYAEMLAERLSRTHLERAERERARAVQQDQQRQALVLATAEARIREPLAVLSRWSRRLHDGGPDLPAQDLQDAVQALGGSAAQVARHLDQLLDEARGEILSQVVRAQPLRLRPLLVDAFAEADSAPVLDCDDALTVVADRLALEQSLVDVAGLLLARCPADSPVRVHAELVGEAVEVQLRHDGGGWSRDVDLFAPVGADARSGEDVTGRLFLARTLVEATGGTVHARAHPGGPCTITVWLPAAACTSARA